MRLTFSLLVLTCCQLVAADDDDSKHLVVSSKSNNLDPQNKVVFLNRDEEITIFCKVFNADDVEDTKASVNWARKLEDDNKWQVEAGAKITIRASVGKVDGQEYRCKLVDGDDDEEVVVKVYVDQDKQIAEQTLKSIESNHDTFVALCGRSGLGDNDEFKWYHNGEKLEDGEASAEFSYDGDTKGQLTRYHMSARSAGIYVCVTSSGNSDESVFTNVHVVRVTSGLLMRSKSDTLSVSEGEETIIECDTFGYPPARKVNWKQRKDDLLVSDLTANPKKFVLTPNSWGLTDGKLTIRNVTAEDRAEYVCEASNLHGGDKKVHMVRVKDGMAALWPFLGILVEVMLLLVIIFIFERRQAAKNAREDEEAKQGLTAAVKT